ncbi:MAG: carbonic anhydrase [Magnetococcales bacterium]|nr:carbonic anhydrase [Magnetococcales bacterium]MBF0115564.1 carbonic anhydrase [Magnetococcales bacterium]
MCDSPRLSRRTILSGLAVGFGAIVLPKLPWIPEALASGAPSSVTPDQALQWLKEGHTRFLSGKTQTPHLTAQRIAETASQGQHPFATLISCSDSRVPVEHIFDQGIGDLFVIRVAGNVADTDEIGTAEYGAGHLATPLLVVVGHTKCGAVTAVVKGDEVGGSIPQLVDNIVPAAQRAKAKGLSGDALIVDAIRENVYQSLEDLRNNSEELTHLEHQGKLKMVGAVYHIEDGSVEWLPDRLSMANAATARDAIEQAVYSWAGLWSASNVERYLACYAPSFHGKPFANRKAWEAQRRKALLSAGVITLSIDQLQISLQDANHGTATFLQGYQGKSYQDKVKKRLTLQLEKDKWLIVGEEILKA